MRMNKKKEIVPKLRFPEFSKSYWGITRLNVLADKITERNKDDRIKRVFTNSATEGVIDQGEYFDRNIANKNNLIILLWKKVIMSITPEYQPLHR